MTREERLELLKLIEKDIAFRLESTLLDDEKICAIHSVIEELEQEPCDDCISRKSVIDVLIRNRVHFCDMVRITSELKELPSVTPKVEECEDAINRKDLDECIELMTDIKGDTVYAVRMSDIRQLPPVTPKQKMGRWEYTGFFDEDGMLECSVCGREVDPSCYHYKFCPMCGAKMEGEQ